MSRLWKLCALLLVAVPTLAAKETPLQSLDWPDTGTPVIRFSFSKFKELDGNSGKQRVYIDDVTAVNLSNKVLDSISLTLYVFDKAHVRIGDGLINLNHVQPGETIRFELTLNVSGVPTSVSLAANTRTLSITINTVPQGAEITLDGKDVGVSPKLVDVTLGKHMLEFKKDGYNTGTFPFEMGPRDVDGGSLSYELGVSALDTIELRDGSVLSGDLVSINGMEVQIRVGGNVRAFDRNQIKRISLTQRQQPSQ